MLQKTDKTSLSKRTYKCYDIEMKKYILEHVRVFNYFKQTKYLSLEKVSETFDLPLKTLRRWLKLGIKKKRNINILIILVIYLVFPYIIFLIFLIFLILHHFLNFLNFQEAEEKYEIIIWRLVFMNGTKSNNLRT